MNSYENQESQIVHCKIRGEPMRKIVTALCIGVMILQSTLPVMAQEEYVGKMITLEKQEGQVSIENSAKRELTLRDGAKLYNGYEVYTEDGYAWVVLDENGVLKMDLDTKIKIEKTENQLEVVLEEGEVFFNIDEQFAEDEKFSIRTSTMTTGIRGTAGIVSTRTIENSGTEFSIKLLEGDVELTYLVDKATDTHYAELLSAGQTFALHTPTEEQEDTYISTLTGLTADDVNGFVAVEIKNSTQLQEKLLTEDNDMNQDTIDEIIGGAEDKLEQEQEQRTEIRDVLNDTTTDTSSVLNKLANPFDTSNDTEDTDTSLSESLVESNNSSSLDGILADTSSSDNSSSSSSDSSSSDSSSSDSSSSGSSGSDSSTDDTTVVDIAIIYYCEDGTTVFATQAATSEVAPTKPILQPTESGYWAVDGEPYDFTEVLTKNTSMTWGFSY